MIIPQETTDKRLFFFTIPNWQWTRKWTLWGVGPATWLGLVPAIGSTPRHQPIAGLSYAYLHSVLGEKPPNLAPQWKAPV